MTRSNTLRKNSMNKSLPNLTKSQPNPLFQQAVQFHTNGQLEEAASLFETLLQTTPEHFPTLHRLAAIRRQQGRHQESLTLLKTAARLNPSSAEIHNSLGNTLNMLGRSEEAVAAYQESIALRQDVPEVHQNLANSFRALARYEEAALAYQTAIALRANYADAHTNLGLVLDRLGRPEEALASLSKALTITPEIAMAHNNVGMALLDLSRHEEALPHLQRARELDPAAPEFAFNHGLAHLGMGNFEFGWPGYEARWHVPALNPQPPKISQPMWDGQSDIAGKTILLHAEQGLGDSILFSRFIAPIIEKGARVILAVQPALIPLFSSIPCVSQVLPVTGTLPDFDLHVPFCSLPMVFKTTLQNIPSKVAYLTAPAESPTLANLDQAPGPRIGICWTGNPKNPSDHKRSIPLSIFQRILQIPGARFVSLQQNLRPGDTAILSQFPNLDITSLNQGATLADTAALISKLDLIITVDTAIAHLAGALGRPVWILLRFNPYWVWLRHRTDSPWYPTARLFRQPHPGDWPSTLENLIGARGDGPL